MHLHFLGEQSGAGAATCFEETCMCTHVDSSDVRAEIEIAARDFCNDTKLYVRQKKTERETCLFEGMRTIPHMYLQHGRDNLVSSSACISDAASTTEK